MTAPTTETPHVILHDGIGMDQWRHLWFDTPDGPKPWQGTEHPMAHLGSIRALCWLLDIKQTWRDLTPAQRRALTDPTAPGLRCLPALEARGLVRGTARTDAGELLLRVVTHVNRAEAAS